MSGYEPYGVKGEVDALSAALARAEAAEAEVKRLKNENDGFVQQISDMRHTADWHKSQEAMKLQNELVRQRDEAFAAGAEAMREACAVFLETRVYLSADGLRALPIPTQEVK